MSSLKCISEGIGKILCQMAVLREGSLIACISVLCAFDVTLTFVLA